MHQNSPEHFPSPLASMKASPEAPPDGLVDEFPLLVPEPVEPPKLVLLPDAPPIAMPLLSEPVGGLVGVDEGLVELELPPDTTATGDPVGTPSP